MDHVLVTGAAGMLGREVVSLLRSQGTEVTALERHECGDVADRVVVGDAGDPEVSRAAVDGVHAVVHLAAIPSPEMDTAERVFCGNTAATFTVLEQAAQAGVRRAVVAGSYSITGLPWTKNRRHPAYLPIDERIPLQVEDPYGLSKQVDELTAQMMWWRHGLSTVALRFPFLGGMEARIAPRAERFTAEPALGASECWTYLDTRDAAVACTLALTEPAPGFHAVGLAAPTTLVPYPTEQLLDAFHPAVPRRTVFAGRCAPVDVSRAQSLLGWSAEHLLAIDERDLEPTTGGPR